MKSRFLYEPGPLRRVRQRSGSAIRKLFARDRRFAAGYHARLALLAAVRPDFVVYAAESDFYINCNAVLNPMHTVTRMPTSHWV